jgi:hypothetical protein
MANTINIECSCGWDSHRLEIDKDDPLSGEILPHLYITIINAPSDDMRFIERVQMAWSVLRGAYHVLSEIILSDVGTRELVDYVASLPKNTSAG